MSDFNINVKLNGIDTAVTTIGELEAALKATKAELKGVEIGGQAFESLSEQARVLQREFKDSFKEATNFEQNLGQITESVGRLASTITSGFSIAMSAVSLFGGETKELSEQQVKAQQALTLALSAATIATNAARISEDIRNVGLGIQAGLVKLLTLLTGAQAAATTGQTIATQGATVAQRVLNATMAANPIGLVVAALAALVGAFIAFSGETEKATGYVADYNAEIDRTTKAIDAEIQKKKELTKIQGDLNESLAKGEANKLKIRLETQKALGDLDQEDLDNQKSSNAKKLRNAEDALSDELILQLNAGDEITKITDVNYRRELIKNEVNREKKLISETDYFKKLIEIRTRFFDSSRDGDQKDFDAKNNILLDLIDAQKVLQGEQEILDKKKVATEEKTNNDISKTNAESNKKRLAELKKYNDDVENLNKNRVADEKQIQRDIEDAELERISLVKGEDGVYREDLIAGFNETIAKLKVARDRSVEDAKLAFDKEIESFRKSEKEKVDSNGKRVISDKKINDEIAKQTETFNKDQVDRQKTFTNEITNVESDKANQIAQIDEVLKSELTFGDNDLSDSKKKLALDEINLQIDISNRKIELEKSLLKSSIDAIKQRQDLESRARVAELAATEEQINISRKSALQGVVGTEEQKSKQRKAINDKADQDILNARTSFNLKEQEADKASTDEIFNYRAQKLQEFVQLYSQVSSTISGLLSAISESQKVDSENTLMQIRDDAANQTNAITTEYNKQVEAQQAKLKAGEINQAQYNAAINGLNKNLSAQTLAADKAQKAKELAEKKKAFESDKKLKIAQAIMAGAMGALSAFTGAMQLGPIAGPIVGAILAGLVVATTAVQVSNISKTKFDGGGPEAVAPVSTSVDTSAADTAATNVNQASGGGFTQFSSTLLNQGTSGTGTNGTSGMGPTKVYVVESDITEAQRRVYLAESNATI